MVFTSGPMELHMMVSGNRILWMDLARLPGATVPAMLVISFKTKKKAEANTSGLMAAYTMENGSMESSMVMAATSKLINRRRKDAGKTER